MRRLRSILPLILVLITSLLVSCGGPSAAKAPPTYTAEAIEQLDRLATPIETARKRMPELGNLISERNWVDVENFIHGPLGSLRHDMSYVARSLLPDDQKKARTLARDIFGHIERIDAAAKERQYSQASSNYNEVIGDIDAFLNLIPSQSSEAA